MSNQLSDPVVSVIVPCHNYGNYLAVMFESLFHQTYQSWECIVIDNGSSDNTAEVCKAFCEKDQRIKYHRQENEGPANARNEGLKRSSGKYVQFLDADDYLQNSKFTQQVNFLESHPETDLVYGDAYYFKNNPGEMVPVNWLKKINANGASLFKLLLNGNIMPVHSPLIRRSMIDKAGPFDEQLMGYEDWELFLRFAMNGASFHFLDQKDTGALIRLHQQSLSSRHYHMDRFRLVVMEKTFYFGKMNLSARLYLFFRILQQHSHLIVKKISGKKVKIIHAQGIPYSVILLLQLAWIIYVPLYILVELIKMLTQKRQEPNRI